MTTREPIRLADYLVGMPSISDRDVPQSLGEWLWADRYLAGQVDALLAENATAPLFVTQERFERRVRAWEIGEALRDFDR